ncbi:MAG: type II and III secretion system protein family protein [Polymorphobacter sp.]
MTMATTSALTTPRATTVSVPTSHPPLLPWMRAFLLFMQRWGVLLCALLWLAGDAVPAAAQTRIDASNDARSGAVMLVPVNKSQTLRVERAIGKAAIGNDAIADVLPVSISSVYVLGKAVGSTNLSLFDRKGGLIAVVDIVVTPDSQGLKRKLAELLPGEAVGVTVSNDSVVLDGRISSAAAAERVMAIAETYAPKKVINMMSVGTAQQIMLEVRFSEMSRGTVKQLGISNLSFGIPGVNTNGVAVGPAPGTGGYSALLSFPGANLSFQLDALESQGLVRTLAQPNIVALSGETASFLAGGEFPIPTGVALNGQVSIEFKEFGVSLKFTPTLLEDGLINMVVAPEVSALDPAAGIDLNGLRIPGLRTRRANTTLELRDGQSFAVAGLIQSDFNNTISAIPLLGKLPIIGALFRSTSFNRNETELVIVVTPRIVRPLPAGGGLALPTDRVKEPSDSEMFLLGEFQKLGPIKPALPLPGPESPINKPRTAAGDTAIKAGGIEGDFGHIVR